MKKLLLIDAYSLIFRAYYAFIRRPVTTSKGFDTSAIFGFTKSLQEVLKKEMPTHVAVAFDPPGGSFRCRMYPQYKANRDKTPEPIIAGSPIIKEIIRAYNIPVIEVPDYEADDVIGTMAKMAEKQGFQVYMMTPDKDYGQLVSENVFMYKPKRSGNEVEILGEKEICEYYGIKNPTQVIDILALWGDASDNVPGAPGIGEKTAMKLIADYDSIDGVYEKIGELKGKQQESLRDNESQVRLAKELVTIDLNVPVDFNEEMMLLKPANEDKLKELFTQYEFISMLRDLERTGKAAKISDAKTRAKAGDGQMSLFFEREGVVDEEEVKATHKTHAEIPHNYKAVQTDEEIQELVEILKTAKITVGEKAINAFSFDTETTGTDAFDCRLVGVSFAVKPHEAWYVPVPADNNDKTSEILNKFKPVLENKDIAKIGQNIKFDSEVLSLYGIEVKGELYDTMLVHYLLNPEARHNMEFLSETYLGYSPIEIETLIGKKGPTQRSMSVVPIDKITNYAAEDADVTLQLHEKLYKLLYDEDMAGLYQQIEAPLINVLAGMEEAGVKVDIIGLNELKIKYNHDLAELEAEIREMTGEPDLNVASPKQLGVVLFEKMNISGTKAKMTKTKQYSTDEETLAALSDKHPVINKILDYRTLKKLVSAYIESLPALVNKRTGKIHTSFNQAVTATGRLSSNNPNLQNIPIREARGREIRKAFIPSSADHVIFSADYSQIELRLMAHFSNDPDMISAFRNNEDIHTATAAKIYKIKPSEVTKEQRSRAKTANFGIIYGISAFGLSQRLGISRTDAKQLIDGYFESYPGVKDYMDKTITDAQRNGYATTVFGRKRWLRDINSANSMTRGMAERNAINAPIQGTAADIIKIAMIKIFDRIKTEGYKSRMVLQVHDELVFDVYKPELEDIKKMVIHEMESAASLSVPLTAECGTGSNWLEAH